MITGKKQYLWNVLKNNRDDQSEALQGLLCPLTPSSSCHYLQHVRDIKQRAMLTCVQVGLQMAVCILYRQAPACKGHHLSSMVPVEIVERCLLQVVLQRNARGMPVGIHTWDQSKLWRWVKDICYVLVPPGSFPPRPMQREKHLLTPVCNCFN